MTALTATEAASILGWPLERVRELAKLVRGPAAGSETFFGLRDLVALRGAHLMRTHEVGGVALDDAVEILGHAIAPLDPLPPARLEAAGLARAVRPYGPLWELATGQAGFDLGYSDAARNRTVRVAPRELDADDWFELGVDEEAMDREVALEHYGRALALLPTHADALVNIGRLHQLAGDLESARMHYARALDARPGHVVGTFNLGTVLAEEGLAGEAERTYRPLQSALPDACYNLAHLLLLGGRRDEAREALTGLLAGRGR